MSKNTLRATYVPRALPSQRLFAIGSRKARPLHDQGPARIERSFRPVMLYPLIPILPQHVNAQAVGLRINDLQEAIADGDQLTRIDQAFEDGVLHALAVIEARLGRLTKSPAAGRGDGGDVVGDKDLHAEVELSGNAVHFQMKAG